MNRLGSESSPYLRQHADNPVDWFAWGEEAFAEARTQDKPILLSIGYAACHWCHVMAHESFEDDATAKLMNEWFVNIKVDREERPDVDAVYMEAVQAMTGQGGWPMTVFLTPEGKPFFAGTYFPKDAFGGHRSFTDVLQSVDHVWNSRREELEEQATSLTEAIGARTTLPPNESPTDVQSNGEWWIDAFIRQLHASYDKDWGGFGAAPKFPPSMALETLLRSADEPDVDIAKNTLDAMASGGIYDHIGGGFHRYSVDSFWMVPHFEKMLYDQALLARTYVHAYQRTGETRYRQVAEEIIDFVLRDLRNPDGGYFSAIDADSKDANPPESSGDQSAGEMEEGIYYIWRPSEIDEVLNDPALSQAVQTWYGVTKNGNFEGGNIMHRVERGRLERTPEIEAARCALLDARYERTAPLTDDKVITEWNAMFISMLAEASSALNRPDWLEEAETSASFLTSSLLVNEQWCRSWHRETGARTLGFAADYAWLIDMFTRLGEASGKARWRTLANSTADQMLELFWDVDNGGLFTTASSGEKLIVRQKDLFDSAVPSANSQAALALARLGLLNDNRLHLSRAETIIGNLGQPLVGHPTAFPNYFNAIDMLTSNPTETVIAGDNVELLDVIRQDFLPRNVTLWGELDENVNWEGKTDGAYVCRNQSCGPVASTPTELRNQLHP